MRLNTIIVLIALTIGFIGSIYLIQGTLSIDIESIHKQTTSIRWSGNLTVAKSMIVQKAQSIWGFILLLIAFFLQVLATIIKETKFDKNIRISKVWFILLIPIGIIIYYIVSLPVKSMSREDGFEYVIKSSTPEEKKEGLEGTEQYAYYKKLADLLCVNKKYYCDYKTLKNRVDELRDCILNEKKNISEP